MVWNQETTPPLSKKCSFLALPVHSYNMISDLTIIIHIYSVKQDEQQVKPRDHILCKKNSIWINSGERQFLNKKIHIGHSETVLRKNYLVLTNSDTFSRYINISEVIPYSWFFHFCLLSTVNYNCIGQQNWLVCNFYQNIIFN